MGDKITSLAAPTVITAPNQMGVGVRYSTWDIVKGYIQVTKPISVFLLAFTAFAMMVVAGATHPLSWTLVVQSLLAVSLACAGANAISCYIDRDMDAVMGRTSRRPIPSGRINPPILALYWGVLLFGASLVLAWGLNIVAFAALWGGMLGYVVVYSLWLKRRSVWNIIIGGFSGGLPVIFGWVAVTGEISLLSLMVAALVVLWIPNHIWSLAIFYREEYAKVKVPMLPVVCDIKKALHCLLITVIMMVLFSFAIYFVGDWGIIYLGTAVVLGVIALALSIHIYFRPEQRKAWTLFKFSSPYLFLLFLAMMIDVWI